MDEETDFRGVVRDGQVVLDEPLDLPDGTEVFIEVASTPPSLQMTEEQFREFTEFFTRRNRRSAGLGRLRSPIAAISTGASGSAAESIVNSLLYVRGLPDTPIVLDYRAGWPDPMHFMGSLRLKWKPDISSITVLSMLAEAQDAHDIRSCQVFCGLSTVHEITAKVSRRAQAIFESVPLPSPLTPDDALIAATALIHKLPLYTLDPAKFGIVPGLTTVQPY
jgi:predicted nucleic acid-binding protein